MVGGFPNSFSVVCWDGVRAFSMDTWSCACGFAVDIVVALKPPNVFEIGFLMAH